REIVALRAFLAPVAPQGPGASCLTRGTGKGVRAARGPPLYCRPLILSRAGSAFVRHHDGREQVAPIAVSAVMARGADEFNRDAGLDGLDDRLVQTVQVVGEHTDGGLLVAAHRGGLFLGPLLDVGPGPFFCHDHRASPECSGAARFRSGNAMLRREPAVPFPLVCY